MTSLPHPIADRRSVPRHVADAPKALAANERIARENLERHLTSFEVIAPKTQIAFNCRNCDGRGWVWVNESVTHQLGTDLIPHQEDCSVCEGTGKRSDGTTLIAPECAKRCQQAADYGIDGSCIPSCVYLERTRVAALASIKQVTE